ncbi:MAG TPA: PAS domain-containing methyl-accepting chemotaxis protein [Marinagarivorans sp.]
MRHTGPVTQREVHLRDDDEIVSATDTKGIITDCNDCFCEIAKYSRDELLGQAHNLLRHPDMPQAAFQMMWSSLKAGKPWMGIVKNRCKDGDHYWVSAYVTPRKKAGAVTGYESVRVKASAAQIARAEKAYARLNAGRAPVPLAVRLCSQLRAPALVATLVFAVSAAIMAFSGAAGVGASMALAAVVAIAAALASTALMAKTTAHALTAARQVLHDPLCAYVYTGRCDGVGDIEFSQLAQAARLKTALGRFLATSSELQRKSAGVEQAAQEGDVQVSRQQRELAVIFSAMEQMADAVQEVARSAANTSVATCEAVSDVNNSQATLGEASEAVTHLAQQVSGLSGLIEQLSHDSDRISSVVGVIRGVAEQTNLLALNAAIEAARAGEQGRGFAVVADEVRTLAQRTQESTADIEDIIAALGDNTDNTSQAMENCLSYVTHSVDKMNGVVTALTSVKGAVEKIDGLAQQIAAASEEQATTAQDIERNTQSISGITQSAHQQAAATAGLSKQLLALAERQSDMIEQFR